MQASSALLPTQNIVIPQKRPSLSSAMEAKDSSSLYHITGTSLDHLRSQAFMSLHEFMSLKPIPAAFN